jgi:hypothetical protein
MAKTFDQRMDEIHTMIESIPDGPCPSYEERYQKAIEEAQELAKWAVFIEAGAKVKRD